MLNFMRDNNLHESTAPQKVAADSQVDDQGFIKVSTTKKNTKRSTVILAVCIGLGLLCLFVMIKQSTPTSAKADETQDALLDAAIAKISGAKAEVFSSVDKIVKKFYGFADIEELQVRKLAKNPFKQDELLAGSRQSVEIPISQNESYSEKLELFSIMGTGGRQCCMINDSIVYEGDTVENYIVTKINDNSVSVEKNGNTVILTLGQ